MTAWTIQQLLNWITKHFTDKGLNAPRLSAELLLSHVLSMKRIELYTQFDKIIAKPQLDHLHDLIKRADEHEPVAYLIGRTEFYSLEINVSRDCLIPRSETELLVERAIEFMRKRSGRQKVCDLCTGSGCIAVAIAKNFADVDIIATDISSSALDIAAKNIEKYGLNNKVTLLCGDLFEPILPQIDSAQFDVIVCNPPYVSTSEFDTLDKNVKDYEPKLALLAGADGLDIYRKIAGNAKKFLKPGGRLMLEIGYNQGQPVKELLEKAGGFTKITIEKDFANHDRAVLVEN